jgi:hypothetical protein
MYKEKDGVDNFHTIFCVSILLSKNNIFMVYMLPVDGGDFFAIKQANHIIFIS